MTRVDQNEMGLFIHFGAGRLDIPIIPKLIVGKGIGQLIYSSDHLGF